MHRSWIKRLRKWVGVGLLLLPLATFALGADAPSVRAQDPFQTTLQKRIFDDRVHYQLRVRAQPGQVHIAHTTVVAQVRNSAGFSAVHTLPLNADGHWYWLLSPDEPARYRIDLNVSGQSTEGEPLRLTLDSHYFQFPEPGDPYISAEERALLALEQGLDESLEQAPLPELAPLVAEQTADKIELPPPSQNTLQAVNRVMVYGSILAVNLLAFALVIFGYQMIKNNRRGKQLASVKNTTEPRAGITPSPPMQDIDSEDHDEPPSSEPEPTVALNEQGAIVEPVHTTNPDEPLFPLDDDDWASTEFENSAELDAGTAEPASPPDDSRH